MAISNLTYKDYLWLTKERDGVKGIRLSKDNLPSTLNPIASKTFEHVWSTSKPTEEAKNFTGSGTTGGSTNSLDYYIYFGKIKPTGASYLDSWHIKLRLVTACETNTNYRSEHIFNLYGAGSTVSYAMFNNIYSGSYRNLYYVFLNRLTSTGFNNGFSHLFGIDFYSTNTQNINNSNYKRKFYIEVLEQEGCEVSFFNDWISARNYTPATTSTNYYGYINTSNAVVGMGGEFNAVTNGLQETGDADNYYQIFSYFRPIAGGIGIKGISLISQLPDGTWASFTNSNAQVTTSNHTTTSNVPNTSDSFIIGSPIWYYSNNKIVNAESIAASDYVYSTTHAIDLRYVSNYYHTTSGNANSFAYNGSGFKQSNAYIKINPNFDNGTYKIESLILNEKDQKIAGAGYYIYVGRTYSTSPYQINLEAQNPILYWTGSQFIEYSNYKDKINETNISNTYATKTALSSVQSTVNSAIPLVAGDNITLTKNNSNEIVISASSKIEIVDLTTIN